jgi:hypothetical protein
MRYTQSLSLVGIIIEPRLRTLDQELKMWRHLESVWTTCNLGWLFWVLGGDVAGQTVCPSTTGVGPAWLRESILLTRCIQMHVRVTV